MKRFLILLGLVCLAVFITFLAVTRHFAVRRSEQLANALHEAEIKLSQVESELMAGGL